MEAEDEERPLLHPQSPQDVGSPYTNDGSVDIDKQPALKHTTGNWRACYFILGVEFCESLAFFAISKNLVTYLTKVLHESKVEAARNVNAWVGACFLTPLIGAFLADTYWGRFRTVVVFLPVYFVGMLTLTVSASLPTFSYRGNIRSVVVYIGLYLASLGSGGVKPCTSSFGADQFDSTDPVELPKKRSFFNWYYFFISIGSLLSGTVLVWLQDNVGWGLGFAIPTVLIVFCLAAFVAGSRVYRFRKLGELKNVELAQKLGLITVFFRFLDKAAIVLPPTDMQGMAPKSSWRLCTVTQVEELKMLLRMSPIWASLIIFYAVSGQISSTFVEQGMVMDNHVGPFAIPPASLSIFGMCSILIWVPVYETVLVPLARRFTGKDKGFSQTQRLGIGLALSMLTMVYSALLEMKRLAIAKASGLTDQNVPVPISILWQAPSYFVHGAAEVFAGIGMTEFFYDQSPDAMKSLCTALGQLAIASGAYFNTFVFGVVAVATRRGGAPGWIPDNLNEGHLDYFFWMMATLSILNLAQFVHCSMRYRGKTTS